MPVFIQPQELVIIQTKPETFRQFLTLINPFDFVLHYKSNENFCDFKKFIVLVLSNAPTKFKVQEPNGFLRPKCVVDM